LKTYHKTNGGYPQWRRLPLPSDDDGTGGGR